MDNQLLRNFRMAQAQKARETQQAKIDPTKQMQNKMASLPAALRPGNVGAINRVIWPFWFTSSAIELEPVNGAGQAFTTITQEACFVWMAYSKTVYKRGGTSPNLTYTYIDSLNEELAGQTDGLSFTIRDSSSTRTFHNRPMELDQVGGGEFPSVLPTPIMFLPNSTIEFTFQNNHPTDAFVPFITMFGYRIRIDDAQNLLSLVTG